jgi:hypothetical protein
MVPSMASHAYVVELQSKSVDLMCQNRHWNGSLLLVYDGSGW